MKSLKQLSYAAGSAVTVGAMTLVNAQSAMAVNWGLPQPNSADTTTNTTKTLGSQIRDYATLALNVVLLLAGIVAVFYLIFSGFQYITSAGDAAKAKTARAGIINAVIGIIIILAAFLLVRFAVSGYNTVRQPTTPV